MKYTLQIEPETEEEARKLIEYLPGENVQLTKEEWVLRTLESAGSGRILSSVHRDVAEYPDSPFNDYGGRGDWNDEREHVQEILYGLERDGRVHLVDRKWHIGPEEVGE